MSYTGNEETLIELLAIEYIQKNLGYEFIHGEKLSPELRERNSYWDVILDKRLEKALYRLNPWMNELYVSKAIGCLKYKEQNEEELININNKIHNTLVNSSFTIEQVDKNGKSKQRRVCFIDWRNVNNNDFLVTRQFKVQGINGCVFDDIVIFVNGIPVVVLECKSGLSQNTDENVLKERACKKLNQCMNTGKIIEKGYVKQLFYTNFFTGVLTENNNYIGTINTPSSHYFRWNDCYPFIKQELSGIEKYPNRLALQGIFHKENILDIMSNFIVFERNSFGISKRICRYYQYRAVNKGIRQQFKQPKTKSYGGFIYQTHGSGRYMTMAYLINKIKNISNVENSMIIIVTDRIDSSRRLHNIFMKVGINLPIKYIETSDELKQVLAEGKSEIIITTIQKFQDEENIILNKNFNIIVLVDNAHRSQKGPIALKMKHAIPNATYIGFSRMLNKTTQQVFGKCIDKYSMKDAMEDGLGIKILYEQRILKYQMDSLGINYFNDNSKSLFEEDERIDEIAKDILSHYKDKVYPGGFKAQVVCSSRAACIKYYETLNKYMKEIIGEPLEVGVIISSNFNDFPLINKCSLNKQEQYNLVKRFRDSLSNDKLAFLVVTDMLLADFNAPIQQAIYVDKPLKGDKLAQSIIRVSRPCGDRKQYGYIVDYYGISDYVSEVIGSN